MHRGVEHAANDITVPAELESQSADAQPGLLAHESA
jgi:hypothetical protein